jgi:hypothetical protein
VQFFEAITTLREIPTNLSMRYRFCACEYNLFSYRSFFSLDTVSSGVHFRVDDSLP